MKTFGLLGAKLGHSFSPQIHALLGDYAYRLYEKAAGEVEPFLRSGSFDGLNVTIPYKKTVMPLCSALSESARKIGSVNTILRREDGSLYGDNTDLFGFQYLLKKLGAEPAGKKALILGSGGASLAVRAALTDAGAEAVTISRTGEDNYTNLSRHCDAQIIVNATPVGMYPHNGASPIALADFPACRCVLDLVYNPERTALILDAESLGIPCLGGLPMLVAQAKRACELFLGKAVGDAVIDDITEKIARRERNVVLIGMPGCGKSTIGLSLAQATGRRFFDTDVMIAAKAGREIPRIFAEDGEEAFRRLESACLAEAAMESGCVIATGGGIVTRPSNLSLIRQNGFAVFLDRDLFELASGGRPLTAKYGIEALARERRPLYLAWSERTFAVRGVAETANAIKEALKL